MPDPRGGGDGVGPAKAGINVDVNVKVDKALNDFFGDIDKKAAAKP